MICEEVIKESREKMNDLLFNSSFSLSFNFLSNILNKKLLKYQRKERKEREIIENFIVKKIFNFEVLNRRRRDFESSNERIIEF